MRIYAPNGDPYDGEPVDCRELKQLHGYTDLHPDEIAEQAKQAKAHAPKAQAQVAGVSGTHVPGSITAPGAVAGGAASVAGVAADATPKKP